jgi:sarcosine oxidase
LHVRGTFRVRGSPPNRMSCLQDSSMEYRDAVYGSPYPSRDMFGVGVGGRSGELAADDMLERLDELRTRLSTYVRAALPGLAPEPVTDVTCWVTRLPWGNDGVAAWTMSGITAIAGNNLFKLAPALGELLAETVCAGEVPAMLRPETELGRDAALSA